MASPFASSEHYQVSTTQCFCGNYYPSLLALDTHLHGPLTADQMMRDRIAALTAMQTVVPDALGFWERKLFGPDAAIGGGRP